MPWIDISLEPETHQSAGFYEREKKKKSLGAFQILKSRFSNAALSSSNQRCDYFDETQVELFGFFFFKQQTTQTVDHLTSL